MRFVSLHVMERSQVRPHSGIPAVPVTVTDLGLTFSQTWWLCFLHSLLPGPPGGLDTPRCTGSFWAGGHGW